MRKKLHLIASIVVVVVAATACGDVTARVGVSEPFASGPAADTTVAVLGDASRQTKPAALTEPAEIADEPAEVASDTEETGGSWTSPTPAPEPAMGDEVTTLGLDADIYACILDAPGGGSEVIDSLLGHATPFDELPVDVQIDATDALFECAPSGIAEFLAETLNSSFENTSTALPYFLGRCLERELSPSNPQRDSLLAGWTHMRAALPVPAEYRDAVVFTLTICVPDDVFGEVLLGEVGYTAPAFLDSVSSDCLEDQLAGDELRLFWEAYVERKAVGDALQAIKVAPALSSALQCASIGVMIAEEAAKDGVDLSTATIECIDQALVGVNMAPLYLESEDSTRVRGLASAAIESCLSPSERAAGGS